MKIGEYFDYNANEMNEMINKIRYYDRIAGTRGALSVISSKITGWPRGFCIVSPGLRAPVHLRTRSSDIAVYEQIFVDKEYSFDVRRQPEVILDAGANSGLASVYFANRFPEAKIIAIEPEDGNYCALLRNAEPYPGIIPVHAALWHRDEDIDLCDPGQGTWAFRTQARGVKEGDSGKRYQRIRGIRMPTLMRECGIEHIDVLKIDIEGAEREVFETASAWIENVDALIVELHEETAPGCTESMNNIALGFGARWQQGENLYLARSGGCLVRSSH